MMTSTQLDQQIEKLVRDHIAACRKAVTAAVERAFTTAKHAPAAGEERTKPASRRPQPRRGAAELEVLGEQLYEAVCATPGETMLVLAAQLGTSPRHLQVPAGRLKRAGRVRSVGRRQGTRYFPMAMDETRAKRPVVAVGRAS